MSCGRDVPGDFELEEVIEAANSDWGGITEDDGGIIIDGPVVSCNAQRLDEGSDRVQVWNVNAEDPVECDEFINTLVALRES